MSTYVVMAAGGSGTRMKTDRNKVLMPLCGETVLTRSIRMFEGLADGMVIVYRPSDRLFVIKCAEIAAVSFPILYVPGG